MLSQNKGMTVPEIKADNISLKYGDANIFMGLSFSLFEGECLIITGPSGSGKSTLLRCLNRLIVPDEGSVYFRGGDISRPEATVIRRNIVLVGQTPSVFPGTVLDNLRLPFSFAANRDLESPDFGILAESCGLKRDILDRDAAKISGGEKQRVAVARALALRPSVLLLDEPTASLDGHSKLLMEDLISALNRERKITFIIVTHDADQAKRMGNRHMHLENGVLEEII
ncbi:ABC transporter ATP-binding protein [Methanoplanus endosymbiosus]|uniref:ATP-binding cassette domain-containing protein n=1 Tax=Methanoplanus endosymbiosus TaxID=33865 RepID=A0A9E7PMC8_9EURY|nr:ATP-binding cassette domain-containing protein [Methanoplanus endosymbiosus]UUX91296.1 ATP-binding cassette domain-containing protein [Methanoplanus endosymbiosus]